MGNGGVLVKGVKGGKPYIDISISISEFDSFEYLCKP